jgi:hypothetical protein
VADSFKMLGKHYVREWKMNIAYVSHTNVPLVDKWGDLAEEPMSEEDAFKLYNEARRRLGKPPSRITVITGPYQQKIDSDFFNVVIDVDDLGVISKEEKKALEQQLAREGYTVVSTPRGFHLHFRVKRNTTIYAISLVRESEGGKLEKVGEGASLQKHLWTSPPSKRVVGDKFFTYSFVLPSGERFARYELKLLETIEPPTVSFDDVKNTIESYLGYRTVTYSPDKTVTLKNVKFTGKDELTMRVKPLFLDMDEFHARIHNFPLPLPVARILFNYYKGVGAESLASSILAKHPQLAYDSGPIPHGQRFLASAEFTLFVAHTVAFVKYSEILEILSYGIEDFPADEGMSLDRKLRYLLLFDDETGEYVYPRYNGLGPLRPVAFCENCFWREECEKKSATPWRHFRRLVRRIAYGKSVPAQYSTSEVE